MILYIGNKMSKHGMNPTGVETLGTLLQMDYPVKLISDRKNPILRSFHIVTSVTKNFLRLRMVLVDMYSTNGFYYSLLVAFICRIIRVPYIPILRGGNLPQRFLKDRLLMTFILRYAQTIVAPSSYLYNFFCDKRFLQLVLIPNNIQIDSYVFKPRTIIKPRFLWVRSFHSIYNPQLAVRVFQRIKQQFPDASMTMVGAEQDGSLEACRQLSAQLNVTDSIIFTGKLSKAEWITLSEEHDIFFNTTNFDNMPVSVMEAMALGLPIISTNVGGIPYLLQDGEDSLLVEANDEQAMVSKVNMLLSADGLGLRLSKAARKKAEGFDWNIIKEKWNSILSQ